MTSLTVPEFDALVPIFAEEYAKRHSPTHTQAGEPRQRKAGGGNKPHLATPEDQLLFILVYQKTYPLQTAQSLQFGLSQSQTNEWIHRLLPILERSLVRLKQMPERDAQAFATTGVTPGVPTDLIIDGTERRRQRPKNPEKQREAYSGKKKTHTDKNVILINEHTCRVDYLSQTYCGKTHDKKIADTEAIQYPPHATLDKDTGFQGYEPPGVLTFQPKKKPKGKDLGIADMFFNRLISSVRIRVEHVLASVKRCRIVKDVFRNTKKDMSDLAMRVACALHNWRISFRHPASSQPRLVNYSQ